MSEPRPDHCPMCGQTNDCGVAAGKSECWCFQVKIGAEVLERKEANANACLCAKCANVLAANERE